jgi:cysteine-rich repeat protein
MRTHALLISLAIIATSAGCADRAEAILPDAQLPGCGNRTVEPGEDCEDGNRVDGDGCDTNCTFTRCGNGIASAGEICDDGNEVEGDGCDGNCTATGCGNGRVTSTEQCDDGNRFHFDGCSSTCVREPAEVAEIEPNDDGTPSLGGGSGGNDFATTSADVNGPLLGTTRIVGRMNAPGDEDVFAFENPSASVTVAVRFEIWDPTLGIGVPCPLDDAVLDSVLQIRDVASRQLDFADDSNGACPSLELSLGPRQRLYAQVLAFADLESAATDYVMQVTYSSPVAVRAMTR